MPTSPVPVESAAPALEAFLLGQVDFDRVLALQRRLVHEAQARGDGQVTLLLCEHRPIITLGRGGSPADVGTQNSLVRTGQIEVRWVNRGGGCLVHCPGQLAIYPIVPLRWHGLLVGQYLERLQAAIVETLDELNVPTTTTPQPLSVKPRPLVAPGIAAAARGYLATAGVFGRTGQLAALGVAVRHWVTYYGAYLNVSPPNGLLSLVEPRTSSLVAERCGPVRMTAIRAALVRRLSEQFGCDRYHLYTGHPLLRETSRRVGDG
ncbi:MAG: hypothetical protein ABFC96_04625 [Thermoguttaceae bacterium]